jgi:alanine-synthesizing transaminase
LCREHGLALIVDEVFMDYALVGPGAGWVSFVAQGLDVLTFVVSGISKIAGLPQMKAAWLVALGPGSDEALRRLEVLADTFLSMNAPIQRALPVWLEGRRGIQAQILDRLGLNLAGLDRALAGQPKGVVSRLKVEGGWYVILRIPATYPDERTALELLERGVLVYPGHYFGMRQAGWLVLSLLTAQKEFSAGIQRLLEYFQENQ